MYKKEVQSGRREFDEPERVSATVELHRNTLLTHNPSLPNKPTAGRGYWDTAELDPARTSRHPLSNHARTDRERSLVNFILLIIELSALILSLTYLSALGKIGVLAGLSLKLPISQVSPSPLFWWGDYLMATDSFGEWRSQSTLTYTTP